MYSQWRLRKLETPPTQSSPNNTWHMSLEEPCGIPTSFTFCSGLYHWFTLRNPGSPLPPFAFTPTGRHRSFSGRSVLQGTHVGRLQYDKKLPSIQIFTPPDRAREHEPSSAPQTARRLHTTTTTTTGSSEWALVGWGGGTSISDGETDARFGVRLLGPLLHSSCCILLKGIKSLEGPTELPSYVRLATSSLHP